MRNLTLLSILFVLVVGCKKDNPIIIPPPPDPCISGCDTVSKDTLKIVWQTPLGIWPFIFTAEKLSPDHFLLHDNYLSYIINFEGPEDVLFNRNLNDGSIVWTWDEPIEINDGSDITDIKSYDGKIILGSWHDVFVIDTQNGITDWFTDTETTGGKGEPRIGLIGDYIYHSHTDRITDGESVYLVRSPVHTPQWDTLFSVHKSELEGFSPYGEPPNLWMHPAGDSVLIYLLGLAHFGDSKQSAGLYAYNLSQDTILWSLRDISFSIRPHPVYNNKIYVFGATTVFCIDALNGEIIWSKQFDDNSENSGFGNVIVAENRLIAKTDWHTIYALDLETGEEIWRTENAGTSPSRLQYYDGNVYYSSIGKGKIFGVNVQTGKIVFEHDSPNEEEYHDASFTWAGVQIDTETGYLYTADGYFVMCIDLNE